MPDADENSGNDTESGGSKPRDTADAASSRFLLVIKQLVELNPTAASLILAGVAAFMGLALVLLTGTGPHANISNILILILLGFSIIIVARVLDNQIYVKSIGFFAVFLLFAWVGLFILSHSIFAVHKPKDLDSDIKMNVACMVEFMSPCAEVRDRWASYFQDKQKPEVPGKPIDPAQSASSGPPMAEGPPVAGTSGGASNNQKVTDKNPVYVRFAGTFVRSDVQAMMQQLQALGWNMQETDKGGERTSAAAGKRVIRYGANVDPDAVERLKRALSAFNIVPKNMTMERDPQFNANSIDIWMGN